MHEIQKFDINHMAAITEVKCPINSVQIFLKYQATDKETNKWVLLYDGDGETFERLIQFRPGLLE